MSMYSPSAICSAVQTWQKVVGGRSSTREWHNKNLGHADTYIEEKKASSTNGVELTNSTWIQDLK
jgi:hypothetical protein